MTTPKSPPEHLIDKPKAINRYLIDEYLLVHVNPQAAGTTLPAHLMSQITVTLKLSKLFRGGIAVEDDRIVTDLLFGEDYFTCIVPFTSIWGLTTMKGESMVWPESVPPHVKTQIEKAAADAKEQAKEMREAAAEQDAGALKGKGHLKRVK